MQREMLKTILDMMSKHGITRISFNPRLSDPCVEIWSLNPIKGEDMDLEYWRPSREEIEYYSSEYDKCFGTAPRSDE